MKRRVWYLVGFCHLRKEVRMFDVNRVFAVKHRAQEWISDSDDFEVAPWRTLEPWDIASHDAVVTRIRLERPVASLSSFSNATVIAEEEDGSVLIELTVRNNEALFGFIMSLWGRAVILSPLSRSKPSTTWSGASRWCMVIRRTHELRVESVSKACSNSADFTSA